LGLESRRESIAGVREGKLSKLGIKKGGKLFEVSARTRLPKKKDGQRVGRRAPIVTGIGEEKDEGWRGHSYKRACTAKVRRPKLGDANLERRKMESSSKNAAGGRISPGTQSSKFGEGDPVVREAKI